jgi:hypothetical protein
MDVVMFSFVVNILFAKDKSELVVSLLQLPLIIIEMFLVVH